MDYEWGECGSRLSRISVLLYMTGSRFSRIGTLFVSLLTILLYITGSRLSRIGVLLYMMGSMLVSRGRLTYDGSLTGMTKTAERLQGRPEWRYEV